jgi:hypothetical protein
MVLGIMEFFGMVSGKKVLGMVEHGMKALGMVVFGRVDMIEKKIGIQRMLLQINGLNHNFNSPFSQI